MKNQIPEVTRKNVWLGITVIYMLLLTVASLRPSLHTGPTSSLRQMAHNSLHVPAYFFFTYILARFFQVRGIRENVLILAFGSAVLYGGLMEILQGFVPGRTVSFFDMCLNALGAGLMVYWMRRQS